MSARTRNLVLVVALSAASLPACSTAPPSDRETAIAALPPTPSTPSIPSIPSSNDQTPQEAAVTTTSPKPTRHPYVGMWVTSDGHIRQELTADGRYDEARGTRTSAYTGSYTITGNQIDYVDDTGFTADGTFVDADTLHHGGMIFHRRR
ncbi:Atu4866 domain-containing protein [Nonomuraea sp. LPB2021202275-12-8]|uniref:Atu4866 domain-containing protein n=1 Tax=Nonomuraea sp. LPB2021202275-12-8 TaxID=3120159 RepID=UPI00300C4BB7